MVALCFRLMVQGWFEVMRMCGADVREAMHDGCPTACVGDAAFAYVSAYKAHASVGFLYGAPLYDPGDRDGGELIHLRKLWRYLGLPD